VNHPAAATAYSPVNATFLSQNFAYQAIGLGAANGMDVLGNGSAKVDGILDTNVPVLTGNTHNLSVGGPSIATPRLTDKESAYVSLGNAGRGLPIDTSTTGTLKLQIQTLISPSSASILNAVPEPTSAVYFAEATLLSLGILIYRRRLVAGVVVPASC
jgi:hypothetical protein